MRVAGSCHHGLVAPLHGGDDAPDALTTRVSLPQVHYSAHSNVLNGCLDPISFSTLERQLACCEHPTEWKPSWHAGGPFVAMA